MRGAAIGLPTMVGEHVARKVALHLSDSQGVAPKWTSANDIITFGWLWK